MGTYESLFRLRFGLTVNDPRYLEATIDEMIEAYWEDYHDQRRRNGDPDEEEVEDENFDQDEIERLMAEHPDDWLDILNNGGGE